MDLEKARATARLTKKSAASWASTPPTQQPHSRPMPQHRHGNTASHWCPGLLWQCPSRVTPTRGASRDKPRNSWAPRSVEQGTIKRIFWKYFLGGGGGEIGGRGRCEVGANFTGCAIFRIEYFINNIMVKDTYFSKWNCLTQDSTRVGRQQLYIYMQLFQELQ